MRLTKRQLKRIIREEYSRLKRRGLIKENTGSLSFPEQDLEELALEELESNGGDIGMSADRVMAYLEEGFADMETASSYLDKCDSGEYVCPDPRIVSVIEAAFIGLV